MKLPEMVEVRKKKFQTKKQVREASHFAVGLVRVHYSDAANQVLPIGHGAPHAVIGFR
jgi:hypothetical protein